MLNSRLYKENCSSTEQIIGFLRLTINTYHQDEWTASPRFCVISATSTVKDFPGMVLYSAVVQGNYPRPDRQAAEYNFLLLTGVTDSISGRILTFLDYLMPG